MLKSFHILIVDDEPNIRSGLAQGLAHIADRIATAETVEEGLDRFDAGDFQLVIADIRLPGNHNGLELISLIKQREPSTTTMVITAHRDIETAIDAMRRGACDFISKPIDLSLIRQQVAKVAEHHRRPKPDAALGQPGRTLAEITEAAEKSGIEEALAANGHHRELTARALGISVRTLHYKMNKYNLHESIRFFHG